MDLNAKSSTSKISDEIKFDGSTTCSSQEVIEKLNYFFFSTITNKLKAQQNKVEH